MDAVNTRAQDALPSNPNPRSRTLHSTILEFTTPLGDAAPRRAASRHQAPPSLVSAPSSSAAPFCERFSGTAAVVASISRRGREEKERAGKPDGKRKTVSLTPRHQRNCMRGNKQNCKARSLARSRITFPQVSSLTPIFLIVSRSVLPLPPPPLSLFFLKLLPRAPPLSYFRGFQESRNARVRLTRARYRFYRVS